MNEMLKKVLKFLKNLFQVMKLTVEHLAIVGSFDVMPVFKSCENLVSDIPYGQLHDEVSYLWSISGNSNR